MSPHFSYTETSFSYYFRAVLFSSNYLYKSTRSTTSERFISTHHFFLRIKQVEDCQNERRNANPTLLAENKSQEAAGPGYIDIIVQ